MAGLILVWAHVVAVVGVVAIGRRALLRIPEPRFRAFSLARPCAGDEPGLTERLASGPPVETFLTTATPDDPALPAIEAAAEALYAKGAEVHAGPVPAQGPNLKVGQLAEVTPAADVLVCIDSDVDLTGVDLDRLVAPLDDRVAATWMAPGEIGGTTLGDRASAAFLNGSLHSFQLLGPLDPNGLVGKAFAVDMRALAQVGGFAAFRDRLGEDMALARALRQAGFTTRMVPGVVPAVVRGRSLADTIARYARWLAVIRAQRPALLLSYPLLFGATTPIVALGLILGAYPAVAVALLARLSVAVAARGASGQSPLPALLDVPLGELVTWAAFLQAATRREVTWRGRRLRLDRSGRVQAVPPAE